MNTSLLARITLLLLLISSIGQADETSQTKNLLKQPNILVIVSDNQGWNDIGYHGSEVRTPVLDRLAAAGVRLNHFYVFPLCSPTRAGFISGRNPSRYGILNAIARRSRQTLPRQTVTIADTIKAQGYDTAIVGKWHLGLRPADGPKQYGFDQTYGYLHGQIDKYTHLYNNGDKSWHRNDRLIDEEGHATDLFEAEAIRFLEQNRDRPFFLYLPFSAPHPPLQEEDKWVRPYEGKIAQESRRIYAASLTHMDAAIGNIIETLERTGQREKTLIVFFSDNGAMEVGKRRDDHYGGQFGPYPVLGDNHPLRGWIGDLYDGNLRTPALLYWPEVLQPRVIDEVTSVLDWYPTLAALAGASLDRSLRLEGRNIWPLIAGEHGVQDIILYCKHASGKLATVRHAGWKLVTNLSTGSNELFNMDEDPTERNNLSERFPEKLQSLKRLLDDELAKDP